MSRIIGKIKILLGKIGGNGDILLIADVNFVYLYGLRKPQ
jgi:hypothetical protein